MNAATSKLLRKAAGQIAPSGDPTIVRRLKVMWRMCSAGQRRHFRGLLVQIAKGVDVRAALDSLARQVMGPSAQRKPRKPRK